MRKRIATVLFLLTMAISLSAATADAAPKGVTNARGSWVETGGACTPQGVDGSVLHLTCTATATAVGTWVGVWVENADLYLDVNTEDVWGTADETFTGRASDGTIGSLHILEQVQIEGSDSSLSGQGRIVGGTGDWAGSSGTYTAIGFNPAVGFGAYEAKWIRPTTRHHRR